MTRMEEYLKGRISLKLVLFFSVVSVCVVFLPACKKDIAPSTKTWGKIEEYYPLAIGNKLTYQVDSIYFNDFDGSIDTTYFQVTELYADTFVDIEGRINYRLERYYQYKKNEADSYSDIPSYLKDVWFVTQTPATIERIEENVRFINLNHPIGEGREWDGNAFNFLNKWEYYYESFELEKGDYANTVTVNRKLDSNVIRYRNAYQVFAKGVGMVEYYHIDVEDDRPTSSALVPILDRIYRGTIVHYKLVDYQVSNE